MTCERGVRLSGSQLEPLYGELAAMASFHGAPNALVETLVEPECPMAGMHGFGHLPIRRILPNVRNQLLHTAKCRFEIAYCQT